MHELRLLASEDRVERLSDVLLDALGALSVSLEDGEADEGAPHEALFGEPGLPEPRSLWRRSRLAALFAGEAEATAAAAVLLAREGEALQIETIASLLDEDWVRLTQAQFAPVEITSAFWVVPSWHDAPPQAERVIRLDPGLAFGTGTHPTTRLCLRWIARHAGERAPRWSRVLDYGCGSGILAIGAALHGARDIDAVDIDPAAVATARANSERNGARVNAASPDAAQGRYALLLANILAKPLELLAPLLASHLDRDADLVLSGILERQAGELRDAYAPYCKLDVAAREDGWVLMSAHTPA